MESIKLQVIIHKPSGKKRFFVDYPPLTNIQDYELLKTFPNPVVRLGCLRWHFGQGDIYTEFYKDDLLIIGTEIFDNEKDVNEQIEKHFKVIR